MPDLFFASADLEADPTWHEYGSVTYTDETATAEISELLKAISR